MTFCLTQWSATSFYGSLNAYSGPLPSEKIALWQPSLFSVWVEYILSYLFKFPSNLIGSCINPPSRIGVVLERSADGFVRNDFLCCHFGTSNGTTTEREGRLCNWTGNCKKIASLCERKSVVVACELLYLDFASEWLVTEMESRLG